MDNDIHHGDFVHAEVDVRDAKRQLETNKYNLEQLEEKNERLFLICETLWSVLVNKLGVSQDEIMTELKFVEESIEARKLTKLSCRACGQVNPASREKCMYCGHPAFSDDKKSPFV